MALRPSFPTKNSFSSRAGSSENEFVLKIFEMNFDVNTREHTMSNHLQSHKCTSCNALNMALPYYPRKNQPQSQDHNLGIKNEEHDIEQCNEIYDIDAIQSTTAN